MPYHAAPPLTELPNRVFTVPNLFTLVRFALIIPACDLILSRHQGWGTLILLAAWASTDWVDGFLARALNQRSRIGQMLDPVADRLGISAVIVCLAVVNVLSWMAVIIIVVVDVAALVFAGQAARRGEISVSFLGKVRTAIIFVAIIALVAQVSGLIPLGLAPQILVTVGLVLHILVGINYIRAADRSKHERAHAPSTPTS